MQKYVEVKSEIQYKFQGAKGMDTLLINRASLCYISVLLYREKIRNAIYNNLKVKSGSIISRAKIY